MSAQTSQLVGNWIGEYTSASAGKAKASLSFFQLDSETLLASIRGSRAKAVQSPNADTVVGIFITSTGAVGTISLTMVDNTFTGTAQQTTPGCEATYQMKGKVVGTTMTWSFTGNDCLGDESGTGTAALFGFAA